MMSHKATHLSKLSESEKIERILKLEARIAELERQCAESPTVIHPDSVLEALLENIPDHVSIRDTDGRYVMVNSAQADNYGSTVEDMIGSTLYDWFAPEVAKEFERGDRRVLETGAVVAKRELASFENLEADQWFDVKKVPLRQDDTIVGVLIIAREVTKEQQALDELQEKHQLLQTLINALPDQIAITDGGGEYTFVNQPFADHIGASHVDEVVGTTPATWFPPDDVAVYVEEDRQIRQTGQPILLKGDKDALNAGNWFEISKVPVFDGQGEVIAIAGIFRDITPRRRAEQEQAAQKKLLETLINAIPDQIFVYDREGRYTVVNQAFVDHVKATSIDTVIGTVAEDWFPAEDAATFRIDDGQIYQSGTPRLRHEVLGSFEENQWFDVYKTPLTDENGNCIAIVGIAREITARKNVEHELSTRNRLLQTLIDVVPDHIYVKDMNFNFALVNRSYAEHLNVKPEDMIGTDDYDWFPEEYAKLYRQEDVTIRATKEPKLDFDVSSPIVEDLWVRINKAPIIDELGNFRGVVGIARDITERRKAEQDLVERERLLQTLIDAVPDHIFITDQNQRYLLVNQSEAVWAGAETPDAMLGTEVSDWFDEETSEIFKNTYQQVLDVGETIHDIEEHLIWRGDEFWYNTTKAPIKDKNGNVKQIVGIARDITPLKQAQQELSEQYNLLRTLIDTIPDLIWVIDRDLRYVVVNEAEVRAAGAKSADEMLGTLGGDWFVTDDLTSNYATDRRIMETGATVRDIEQQLVINGREKWYQTTRSALRDESGTIKGLVAIARDITPLKEAQQELSEQYTLLRTLIDAIPDLVFVIDKDDHYLMVNQAEVVAANAPSPQAMIGTQPSDWFQSRDVNDFIAADKHVLTTGEPLLRVEEKATFVDEERWYLGSKIPLHDKSGEITGLVGIFRDITERRTMEEALRRSERMFKSLAENSPDLIARFDLDNRYVYVNPTICALLNCSADQLVGSVVGQIITGETQKQWKHYRDLAVESGKPVATQFTYDVDGEARNYQTLFVPEYNETGELESTLIVAHDITEIRRSQDALQRSEALIRAIFDHTDIAYALLDLDGKFQIWNQTSELFMKQFLNQTFQKGDNFRDVVGIDYHVGFDEHFPRALKGETIRNVDVLVGENHLSFTYTPLRLESDEVIGVSLMAQDMTEWHQAQQAIRENEANLSALVNNTQDLIWSVDRKYRVIMFNDNLNRFIEHQWGISLKPGMDTADLIDDPALQTRWDNFYTRALLGERFREEYSRQLPDGRYWVFNVSIAPIMDDDGISGVTVYLRDVTERHQMEQAIRENEAKLSALINNTDDRIWSVDRDHKLITYNKNFEKANIDRVPTGIQQGMTLFELTKDESITNEWTERYNRALAGERFYEEYERIEGDDHKRIMGASVAPIVEPDGTITGVTAYSRDITERHYMEQALRESEAQLSALVNNTQDYIWSVDRDYCLITCNENFVKVNMILHDTVPVKGMSTLEGVGGQSKLGNKMVTYFDRALAGESFRVEMDNYDLDSEFMFTTEASFAPIREPDGTITGVTIISRDITETKRIQAELDENRKAYRTLIDNFPNGIVALYDRDLVYTVVGGKGLSLSGLTEADFAGKRLRDIMPLEIYERDEPQLRQALMGESTLEEVSYGNYIFEVQTLPITDEVGNVTSGMLMTQNITERKAAEREALNATLERERVQILEQFIQDVSHEFRTALSRVHLAIHSLRRLNPDEQAERYISRIEEQSDQTLVLIEDLLTAVRVGRDFQMSFYQIHLNNALQQVIEGYRSDADRKKINIEVVFDPNLPTLVGNETYLILAFTKILDNAIRYSAEKGLVKLQTTHTAKEAIIEIKDNGVGMDKDTVARIFERFFRLDTAHSTSGFGLGLPIARRIIEAHDGSINVESEPNVGSTFTVTLPLRNEIPSDSPKLYR